ncbi:MAG: dihydroorotase [Bacillota bacterium]
MRICLKGARLVDPSQCLDGICDLIIEAGKVLALAPALDLEGAEVIDLAGKTIVPGFVDLHVHLREPGFPEKETIAGGCAAATAGGITALACMPNTIPPVDSAAVVELIRERAAAVGLARVYPVGTLTGGRSGAAPADIAGLYAAGVRAFSDDGAPVANSRLFLDVLRQVAAFEGAFVISHSEDPALAAGGVVHEGAWSKLHHVPGIPVEAETVAVARDIILAQAAGARLHLAHVSTAAAVEWVAWAKARGLAVTAEVTPHHLLLNEFALDRCGALAKVNPPLRSEADRKALLQALRDGVIDIIATDHAPHQAAEKEGPLDQAPFGITGLETAVPLLLTELVHGGLLTLAGLVEAYSCRPARLLGLNAGSLRPGSPADLVVLDLETTATVEPERFYSLAKHSPFAGWQLRGLPVLTMIGGVTKMKAGDVIQQ